MLSDPNMPIDNRDLDLLSAYMDDALSPTERTALDARLNAEPDLRRAYDDLMAARRLLRALPKLRAPRDYTLTPAQVRRPAIVAFASSPLVTMVSAAAAVILIVAGVLLSVASSGRLETPSQGIVAFAATASKQATDTAIAAQSAVQSEQADGESPRPVSPPAGVEEFAPESPMASRQDMTGMNTATVVGIPTFQPSSPADMFADTAASGAAAGEPPSAMMMEQPSASPAPMGTPIPPVTMYQAAPTGAMDDETANRYAETVMSATATIQPSRTPSPTETPQLETDGSRIDDNIQTVETPDVSPSPLLIIGGLFGVFALITLIIRRLTHS